MRYSKAFIPTLKEVPKDAITPSHILLLRAGYVRMVGSGIYEMLPLGFRVLQKISNIVREEMDAAGAQQVLMPALLPSNYYKESGRWETFGQALLRLSDRRNGEYHLAPTHEEIITDMVRKAVRSYRQLPLNLYQIQMKYRDEPRPRAGLLRCREFLMKDAYSFDVDEATARRSYDSMQAAYHRIFKRLGLDYRVVEADSGAMGGSVSAEFQVLAQHGEDDIVACASCGYASNAEVAEAQAPVQKATEPAAQAATERVHTPGKGGIDDVVAFLGGDLTSAGMLKCVLYMSSDQAIMAVVRGDHEVNEVKLARAIGEDDLRMANDKEVLTATGTAPGFIGPVGFKGKLFVDTCAAASGPAVTGANEKDYHLRNVALGRDFDAEVADIRRVVDGDPCPRCGQALSSYRGIEGGHVFILGTHYSDKMGAVFQDEQGKERAMVMGCYGIGVSRLLAAAVEQNHDEAGIAWPKSLAPYAVLITRLGKEADVVQAADDMYAQLTHAGVEVLYDDRDERPGVKFKDADLLGIPLRVTVGARGLKEGVVELKERLETDPRKVSPQDCLAEIRRKLGEDLGAANRAEG